MRATAYGLIVVLQVVLIFAGISFVKGVLPSDAPPVPAQVPGQVPGQVAVEGSPVDPDTLGEQLTGLASDWQARSR